MIESSVDTAINADALDPVDLPVTIREKTLPTGERIKLIDVGRVRVKLQYVDGLMSGFIKLPASDPRIAEIFEAGIRFNGAYLRATIERSGDEIVTYRMLDGFPFEREAEITTALVAAAFDIAEQIEAAA